MKRTLILLVSLLALTLSACGKDISTESTGRSETASSPTAMGSALQENLPFVTVGLGIRYYPDPTNDGLYYADGRALAYLDLTSGGMAVLCPQIGCRHNSGSCPAYLDDACGMAVYGGTVYTIQEDGRALKVVCFQPGQIARSEVCRSIGSDNTYMQYGSAKFSHGNILLTAVATDLEDEQMYHLYLIRVGNGTVTELTSWPDTESARVLGASVHAAVVEFDTYTGQPPQRSAYSSDEDYIAAWDTFRLENGVTELRLYDLNDGTYHVLADSKADGYAYSVDPHLAYDGKLLYQLGDELWLYDLSDGTASLQLKQTNVVNYFILDSRIFTITRNGEDGYAFYCTDIGGKTVPLSNDGYTDYLRFTPTWETASYFIGIYESNSGYYQISKADFYAGNYKSAALLSTWE